MDIPKIWKFKLKQKSTNQEEPWIIKLPKDAERVKQLQNKLEEYRKRLKNYDDPYIQMDIISKIEILEQVLEQGQINVENIIPKIINKYKSKFDLKLLSYSFINACVVIDDYCQTGGKNILGGTGLNSKQSNNSRLKIFPNK
ncbi:hypothetical protein IID20_01480 [Patescibacteria group bacterium]|nr:hypothetical protein [Patescibacteria group bacterium]